MREYQALHQLPQCVCHFIKLSHTDCTEGISGVGLRAPITLASTFSCELAMHAPILGESINVMVLSTW